MTFARPIIPLSAAGLAAAGLLGGWLLVRPGGGRDLPIYWRAPQFALVDQQGDTLRSERLRGTVWVSSFIFTNCEGVCPLITARMARFRDTLKAEGLLGREVRLVSITVDPARDTPEVLAEYAARFGGSPPEEWAFLTGAPPEAVREMIQEGFKLSATLRPSAADTTGNYQVEHTPRVVLVDRESRVRGHYDMREPGATERLWADLKTLLN